TGITWVRTTRRSPSSWCSRRLSEMQRLGTRTAKSTSCPSSRSSSNRPAYRCAATARVKFVGGFYAQWEWQVTELDHVSVRFFERLLREEVDEGWTELSCHPGY